MNAVGDAVGEQAAASDTRQTVASEQEASPVHQWGRGLGISVFAGDGPAAEPDPKVTAIVQAALEGPAGRDWTVRTGAPWSIVTPRAAVGTTQGWKLHVSATPLSMEAVLRACLPVLLDAAVSFKFVASREYLGALNSRHASRGYSGKFLTVYPCDDEEAVRVAKGLHEATLGLSGPRVLSDRPFAAGSLVHYRYGAFVEQRRFSHDGYTTWVMFDPEGNAVEDPRTGQYQQPAWVSCPFPQHSEAQHSEAQHSEAQHSEAQRDEAQHSEARGHSSHAAPAAAGPLIGERFRVYEAIRQTNRGGVYRAVDTPTGAGVVIKESRPHIGVGQDGRDERDRLRREAATLTRLAGAGLAPELVRLFEQAGHLFLAEDQVPGVPLTQWVTDRLRKSGWGANLASPLPMAVAVTELLVALHRSAVVVRDFNPNNIMVRPDGALRIIDLELAAEPDERDGSLLRSGTPEYSAPEQFAGSWPERSADSYSLGATLCYLALGTEPTLVAETPPDRTHGERIAEWFDARWSQTGLADGFRSLLIQLMDEEPHRRPSPEQALSELGPLQARSVSTSGTAPGAERPGTLAEAEWQRAVDGLAGYLVETMDTDGGERLWPVSCAQGTPDPCVVQQGAAGPLAVLSRHWKLSGDTRLRPAISAITDWILRRLGPENPRPPGLYFGLSGIAWALHEAGDALDDADLRRRAVELLSEVPSAARNHDITHGTSGIGLALLELGAATGDEALTARAGESAEALIAAAEHDGRTVSWAIPAELDSMLAGRRYHGFAHGTAGIGYFLLAAALALGRADCLDLARKAGDTLLGEAILVDGIAAWGSGTGDPATAPYWCHGASGIGSFLVRLYVATGDERYGEHARMAARGVLASAGRSALAQCHGLAGNGDYLLDVARATGEETFTAGAHRLARIMYASRAQRDGRLAFPDEQGGVNASFGDGASGALAFLLRLRDRGPRMWMADELLPWGEPG